MSPSGQRRTGVYTQLHQHITAAVESAAEKAVEKSLSQAAQHRIVLVGPMGAGKSTVGARLAEILGLARFDSDELFHLVYGSIPEYFSSHGEPDFRRAEEEVVAEVLSYRRPFVLSLGGGSVLSAQTRDHLKYGCHVVNLHVDEHQALDRLDGGRGRPVLAGDPVRNWLRIVQERSALYEEVSQWTLDTNGLDAVQAAQQIIARLNHDGQGEEQEKATQ